MYVEFEDWFDDDELELSMMLFREKKMTINYKKNKKFTIIIRQFMFEMAIFAHTTTTFEIATYRIGFFLFIRITSTITTKKNNLHQYINKNIFNDRTCCQPISVTNCWVLLCLAMDDNRHEWKIHPKNQLYNYYYVLKKEN